MQRPQSVIEDFEPFSLAGQQIQIRNSLNDSLVKRTCLNTEKGNQADWMDSPTLYSELKTTQDSYF
jgi:hypothetical protein